jgi:thiol-disulfide isomerase/thioredoxin
VKLLFALALVACRKDEAPAPVARPRVELVEANPKGTVADAVKSQVGERKVVVYVGAVWCEPCVAFHKAAQAGQLDDELGDVRFVEFDADRDGDRLAAAGYQSRMIPLFAIPRADGSASGKQIEGSRKDDPIGAIVPRLRALLGQP